MHQVFRQAHLLDIFHRITICVKIKLCYFYPLLKYMKNHDQI